MASNRARTLGVIALALGFAGRSAAQSEAPVAQGEPVPAASVTFTGGVAGVGLGFLWGVGILDFRGKRYSVKVNGLLVGQAGGESVTARGTVYHLEKVEDLNGTYSAMGAGGALGSGRGRLSMRNAKGVLIAVTAETHGLELGAGERGVTLQVLSDTPATSGWLPPALGLGQAEFGPLLLQPTLNVQFAGFAEGNAGFNGQWGVGPLQNATVFFEQSNEEGIDAQLDLGQYGTVKGRVSGAFSLTGGGIDAGATNGSTINNHSYAIEDAYLSWQSGTAFPSLGVTALELSYGNQNYQVFDGLMFWDGAQNGGPRGAAWLVPRKAFREAGIATLTVGRAQVEGFHLKFNDNPDTGTRLGGGRATYALDDVLVKRAKTGVMYFNLYASERPARNGLNVLYVYQETTPIPALPDFGYTTSFVWQFNSKVSGLSNATGWYVAPAYTLSSVPWSPQLTYRYASFSGGATRNFDPLFTSVSEWGTWIQGELLGEWATSNSNLNSHMMRLKLSPANAVTVHLLYFKFLLDNRNQAFGVQPRRVSSYQLADEVDAILDFTITNWWSMTAELTMAVPNTGFREAVGGSATWINSMLYTNFNF
jgi:hypothetical protein